MQIQFPASCHPISPNSPNRFPLVTHSKQLAYLRDEVRNLTLAVNELQQLVPEGTDLQHPMNVTGTDPDGEEDKTQEGGEGEGGGRGGGMLRGGNPDEGAGNPDGGGGGGSTGNGDSANKADTAVGSGGQRLLASGASDERQKTTTGEEEGEETREAAAGAVAVARYDRHPAGRRGGMASASAGRRQGNLEGGLLDED